MRRIDARHTTAAAPVTEERFSFQELVNLFGRTYGINGSPGNDPAASFVGYIHDIAERNGVVAAAVITRALLISQVRFVWRNNRLSPTPGRLFGNRDLSILERPGKQTRPELLTLAEQDVSYSGTWYAARKGNELHRLRPDGVKVVLGSDMDPVDDWVPYDAVVTGYIYRNPDKKNAPAEAFLPHEIISWKPEPHPLEWWRGQSWITSVMTEIRNDGQATDHTSKFFENAGTSRLVFTMDPSLTPTQVQEYADLTNERHAGTGNAFKNMFLGGGTDVKLVGSPEAAIGLKDMQGGYETRIAARSRVPAAILGIREGMQGSALNAGNYSATRRLLSDGWFAPATDSLCAAASNVIPTPDDADLAADRSQVLFLQEDQKDAADIQNVKAQAIRQLVDAGYDPLSVIDAVENDDFGRLQHSGLFSVQLQPALDGTPAV